jgi:hypothetical protein
VNEELEMEVERTELKGGYVFALSRSDRRGSERKLVMGKRPKQYPKGALVRLTNDEHRRLTELAKESGLSLSRFLVEAGLTGKSPTHEDRSQRERAILQLARVGNNLNQIARQLNAQRGTLSTVEIEETLEAVRSALERIEGLWQRG